MDIEWINRRQKKLGREPVLPLYTTEDAEKALQYLRPRPYGEIFDVVGGVKARFRDAGHILGSAFIEMWVEEKGRTVKLVFSGAWNEGPGITAILKTTRRGGHPSIESPTVTASIKAARTRSRNSIRSSRSHNRKATSSSPVRDRRTLNIYCSKGFSVRERCRRYRCDRLPPRDLGTEIFKEKTRPFRRRDAPLLSSGDNPLEFPGCIIPPRRESKDMDERANVILPPRGCAPPAA